MNVLSFPVFQSKTMHHVGGMRNFQNCLETKAFKKILTNTNNGATHDTSAQLDGSYFFKKELGWLFSQYYEINSFGNFKIQILNNMTVSSILEIVSKTHLELLIHKFSNRRLWILRAASHVLICFRKLTGHLALVHLVDAKKRKAYGGKDETNMKSKQWD